MTDQTLEHRASPQQMMEFVKMFNQLATLDEELRERLPQDEFELAFDRGGDIYTNGSALGLNVRYLHSALAKSQGALRGEDEGEADTGSGLGALTPNPSALPRPGAHGAAKRNRGETSIVDLGKPS